jgi:hypothetical protein
MLFSVRDICVKKSRGGRCKMMPCFLNFQA